MIQLCEWQIIDEDNGLVMPWLTHSFLAWLKQQDWSDKTVVIFGAGLGDAWLSERCKKLYVIERTSLWAAKSFEYADSNGITLANYLLRPCKDGNGEQDKYVFLPDDDIDVIINDDAYRTEVCQMAVDYFSKKRNGGILVCDNYQQDFVWISPKAEEIMSTYERHAFYQPGHIDHEGKPWNTSYWNITASI